MKQEKNISIAACAVTVLMICLLVVTPTSVRANAIYDAITLVSLNITQFSNDSGVLSSRPEDLLITGDAFIIDEDQIIDGQATTDKFASTLVNGLNPDLLDIGDGLSQETLATGDTTFGTAASLAIVQGLLTLNNFSPSESYTVGFETVWSYLVNSQVTSSAIEFATAESGIFLESLVNGPLFDFTVVSDSEFSDGLLTDQGILTFSIQVAPGESDILTLTSQAIGAASVNEPAFIFEPSILTLLGIGLLSASLSRKTNSYKQLHA